MAYPRTGDVVSGRYEILELIGRGNARVYRALDHTSGTVVALKATSATELEPGSPHGARFEREVLTLKRLDHPHILRYRDHGREGDIFYLVTELLEGGTLEDIGSGFLGQADRVLVLGACLARAFGAAHAVGIVHRDIKPANIWITASGEPRILDYGLARWVAPEGGGEIETIEELTRTGVLLGTVPYMSPEQLRAERADHRSDIFSLCVVLYELAVGSRPYQAQGLRELVAKVEAGCPETLATLRPELGRGAGPALDLLLRKGLHPLPAHRHASMEEMAAALEKARDLSSIPADASLCILLPPTVSLEALGPRTLVGREAELALVREALARARTGRGAVVVVEGPSGSGRSRLADEIVRIGHGEELLCLAASCARLAHGGTGSVARAWLGRAAEVFPEEPAVASALAAFETGPEGATAGTGDARSVRSDAVLAALTALAARMPLLLVVDDLQAADPESLDLISRLAPLAPARRVLLLMTVRTDAPARDAGEPPLEPMLERPEVRRIELAPLGPSDIAMLAGEVYPGLGIPEPVLHELSRRSGGRPGYALALLHWLAEKGHLKRAGVDWFVEDVETLPFPPEASAAVSERLAALDESDAELLRAAAVLGPAFRAEEVAEVMGIARPAVELALARLARRHRLVVQDENGYHFDQWITQEIVYGNLPAVRRAELHARAAEVIRVTLGSPSEPRVMGIVATHYLEAGRPADAFPFALDAGLAFHEAGSPLEAIPWLERARAIIERDLRGGAEDGPRGRLAEIEYARGNCLHLIGRHSDALEALEAARGLAAAAGDDALQARGLVVTARAYLSRGDILLAQKKASHAQRMAAKSGLLVERAAALAVEAHALSRGGEMEEAEERWSEAAPLLDAQGRPEEAAEVHFRLANHHFRLGRYDRAREEYERAAKRAGCANWRLLARIQNSRGALVLAEGNPGGALALFEEAAGLRERIGSRRGLATSLHNIGWCRFALGEFEEARRIYEQVIALRRELAESARRADSQHNHAQVLLALGRVEEALAQASESVATKRDLEDRVHLPPCLDMLGEVEVEIGRPERALAAFDEVLREHPNADADATLRARVGRAIAESLSGRLESAEARFREAIDAAEAAEAAGLVGPARDEGVAARASAAAFLLARGASPERLGAIVAPLVALPEDGLLPEPLLEVRLARAALAEAEGRIDDARRHLGAALALSSRLGTIERTWRIHRNVARIEPDGSPARSEALRLAGAIVESQSRAIRDRDLRQAYLAHPEREALRRSIAAASASGSGG